MSSIITPIDLYNMLLPCPNNDDFVCCSIGSPGPLSSSPSPVAHSVLTPKRKHQEKQTCNPYAMHQQVCGLPQHVQGAESCPSQSDVGPLGFHYMGFKTIPSRLEENSLSGPFTPKLSPCRHLREKSSHDFGVRGMQRYARLQSGNSNTSDR